MPRLAAYVAAHVHAPVEVLGVDALDSAGPAKSFVAKDARGRSRSPSTRTAAVTDGVFGFATLPETVFVNSRGVVTDVHFGAISNARVAQGVGDARRVVLVQGEAARRQQRRGDRPEREGQPVAAGRREPVDRRAVEGLGHRPRRQRGRRRARPTTGTT